MLFLVSSAPFGLAQMLPVSGAVAGPPKAILIDKGFECVHGVAVFLHPIRSNATDNERERMTGQMRYNNPRGYEKSGIIC